MTSSFLRSSPKLSPTSTKAFVLAGNPKSTYKNGTLPSLPPWIYFKFLCLKTILGQRLLPSGRRTVSRKSQTPKQRIVAFNWRPSKLRSQRTQVRAVFLRTNLRIFSLRRLFLGRSLSLSNSPRSWNSPQLSKNLSWLLRSNPIPKVLLLSRHLFKYHKYKHSPKTPLNQIKPQDLYIIPFR
jgi:hypothetical protein